MATSKRPKKKQAAPLRRAFRVIAGVAVALTAITVFFTNLDKLNDLWRKYFRADPIAELRNPRNLPADLFGSTAPVRAELIQAADQEPSGRAYDLYLENSGAEDVLLSEIRFGPGAAYASASETADTSGSVLPAASYHVISVGGRGTVPLSPPYRLIANRSGALRVVIEVPRRNPAFRGTVAFELYSASGKKVASVNRMLGE